MKVYFNVYIISNKYTIFRRCIKLEMGSKEEFKHDEYEYKVATTFNNRRLIIITSD